MFINEVTTPYDEDEDYIGLMTLREFLYYRNPRGKSHDNEVYDTTIASMNRPDRMRQYNIGNISSFNTTKSVTIKQSGIGEPRQSLIIEFDGDPVAVMYDNTLYYTINFPARTALPFVYRDTARGINIEIRPDTLKPIKYISEYVDAIYDIPSKNEKYYPNVISRFMVDDEQLVMRTSATLPYERNSGKTIAVLNEDGMIVASASDEWGATLLRVVQEYRGKNIGKILGQYWYKMNPDFSSGGFSPKGKSNAIRIWEASVRKFLANGWYSDMVKSGKISAEKVREIISSLPERKSIKKRIRDTRPAEPLIYSDLDNSFIVYDKKFYEDQDEKYIYAYGFLRETGGKLYIFALDYDKAYEQIATYIIFQIAYNNKEKLLIKMPPSDHINLNIDGIKVEGDYAFLTQPALDLKKYANAERQYRSQNDKYDEAYYALQELANSKWS